MNRLLANYIDRVLKKGSLELIDAKGRLHRFGDGTGETVRVRIKSSSAELAVFLNP